ncbi:hypothetical protein RCC89_18745 [Cytophagaceae bacterium ABcell3]|nr:hypothetical protein RCC89_18745 [Cytophagaceae bacterium ABcell3]
MEKEEGFFTYLFKEIAENFVGFLTGMGVAGLLSSFFETRSIKNLWGLASKKTIVSKTEYEFMETAISFIAGFIVLMLVRYLFRKKLRPYFPVIKTRLKESIRRRLDAM